MQKLERVPETRHHAWKEHPVRRDLINVNGREHQLMSPETDLRGVLLNLVEVQERRVLANVLGFANQEHEGQKRKDDKTPYIRHPERVSIRIAQKEEQDGDIRLLKIAIAVVHDTREDSKKSHEAFEKDYYATVGRNRFTEQVLEGAYILNKYDETGKKKPDKEYYGGITKAGLWDIKGYDRLDSFIGDIALMETEGQTKDLLVRARKSYSKLQDVFPYVEKHAPEIAGELFNALAFGAIFLTAHKEMPTPKKHSGLVYLAQAA